MGECQRALTVTLALNSAMVSSSPRCLELRISRFWCLGDARGWSQSLTFAKFLLTNTESENH